MTITYPSVTIEGSEFETLAELPFVLNYLLADPSAALFRALAPDDQGRQIVLGSRVISGLNWAGEMTDADQPYAWPRTDVETPEGPVDPDLIPTPVMQAVAELANASANGVDIANMTTTAETQKLIKAGSVEVENFRLIDSYGTPLPLPAWNLIKRYLGGTPGGGIRSRGTCGRSVTRNPFGYTGGL